MCAHCIFMSQGNRHIFCVRGKGGSQQWTNKFGIELPKTVEEAYAAIKKEMKNVRVAFDILGDSVGPPADHQYIRCHMVFDVKMEDFHPKARLVAGGHATKAPATLTYASVMSQETV